MAERKDDRVDVEAERKNVDNLIDEYRRSGIALMTTVVGLSSGGFVGLFQMETTRQLSFLYLIPIAIALLQQLTFYLGSRSRANSKLSIITLKTGYFESEGDSMNVSIDAQIFQMYSNYYFGMSDVFCWTAVLALGLVTTWPLAVFSSSTVGVMFSVSIAACFIYWAYRRFKLKREIKNTEW